MTKSTQQLADELVQNAIRFAPQTMIRGDFLIDETRLEKYLLKAIPLLELLKVARAASDMIKLRGLKRNDPLTDALTNLQKKVEL